MIPLQFWSKLVKNQCFYDDQTLISLPTVPFVIVASLIWVHTACFVFGKKVYSIHCTYGLFWLLQINRWNVLFITYYFGIWSILCVVLHFWHFLIYSTFHVRFLFVSWSKRVSITEYCLDVLLPATEFLARLLFFIELLFIQVRLIYKRDLL